MAGNEVTGGNVERLKKFLCEYAGCDKAFTRPSLLTQHQQSFHQGIREFKCDQCGNEFIKKSHYERHLFSHTNSKPFSCQYCQKRVTTRQQLRRHEVTHTKSFKCTYEGCNESFYKHPQLRAHILGFHLQKLKCTQCDKSFQRPYRLRSHIEKHHNPETDQNPYQCPFNACGKVFKNWSQLQSHTKNDHPKLQCSICKKFLVGDTGLQMHMKIHDESIVMKNWKCTICKDPVVTFAKKQELVEHYEIMHDNILPIELQKKLALTTMDSTATREQLFVGAAELSDDAKIKKIQKTVRSAISDNDAIKNEESLQQYFETTGVDGLSLLMNTVGRKFGCPYNGCSRTFKTRERYDKHIEKHKIHQLKLKLLEEQQKNDGGCCND